MANTVRNPFPRYRRSTRSRSRSSRSRTRRVSGAPRRVRRSTSKARNLKSRKITASAETRNSLAGFINAFASTHGARIPDGSVTHSLGSHHRNVADISYSNQVWDTIEAIVYPGLHGGVVYRAANLNQAVGNQFTPVSYIDYNNSDCNLNGKVAYTVVDSDVYSQSALTEVDGGLSRWRAVSQALRLTLINSDERNDGWWEACRFAYTPKMIDWEVGYPEDGRLEEQDEEGTRDGLFPFVDASYRPNANIFEDFHNTVNATSNWANIADQKSFAVGALKHVHNKQFNLCHIAKDEEFKQVYRAHNLNFENFEQEVIGSVPSPNVNEDIEWTENSLRFKSELGSCDGKRLHDSFVDENLDFIYIRIHMGIGNSRMLLEHAANHEIVYENDSPLAKFMLPGVNHPATNAARSVRNTHASSPASIAMSTN